jgi:acetyltransferase-like isoleucine patch superfamily enzyme
VSVSLLQCLSSTWRTFIKIVPALNARYRLRSATSPGNRVTLCGCPSVSNRETLTIGERVRLVSTVATSSWSPCRVGHLEIGDDVFINYGSSLVSCSHLKLGDDCLIGTHLIVMDCDFHRVEDRAWDTSGRPIIIGERAWLGNRSTVLKGVTIGHDAVVAAGSVVTHDVPPRTLVAGVPARVIREI